MPKTSKKHRKTMIFQCFLEAGSFKGACQGGLLEIRLWSWRPSVANKAANSQDHRFLGPSWAHLSPMSKHLGPLVASRWHSRVDVARSLLKMLIFPCVFDVEVGFVR